MLYLALQVAGIVLTYTGSVPPGFYRTIVTSSPIEVGDLVTFCMPAKLAKLGLERGYLDRGSCSDGSEALLKQVIAVPGDTVVLSPQQITVQSATETRHYVAPRQPYDRNGFAIPRSVSDGQHTVKGYWVYGYASPRYSWDSRYYGGISQSQIQHRVVPLWLF